MLRLARNNLTVTGLTRIGRRSASAAAVGGGGDEEFVLDIPPSAGGRRREHHTTWKFVDRVQVEVKGGRGGNGCVSFEVLAPGRKRPSGGSGGKGGDVWVVADRGLTGMKFQTFHFNADDGTHGGSSGLTGRRGSDVHVRVPVGTIVAEKLQFYRPPVLHSRANTDTNNDDWGDDEVQEGDAVDEDDEEQEEEGEEEEEEGVVVEKRVIKELNTHGETVLVARGGEAGIGNAMMSGSSTQRSRSLPLTKMPGNPGEARSLLLELKIIADVGLVGYPNAGKSTLLRALSNAKPKVAPYPFTTLHPSVGVVEYSDMGRITVADIPGLIDGAADDRGLGHDFLKHIERTKVLLYVIDGAGCDGREPRDDLGALQRELGLYDETLLGKPALVFINKSDVKTTPAGKSKSVALRRVEKHARSGDLTVLHGSAQVGEGLGPLAEILRRYVEKVREEGAAAVSAAAAAAAAAKIKVVTTKAATGRARSQ
jgi:GTP-binding protein